MRRYINAGMISRQSLESREDPGQPLFLEFSADIDAAEFPRGWWMISDNDGRRVTATPMRCRGFHRALYIEDYATKWWAWRRHGTQNMRCCANCAWFDAESQTCDDHGVGDEANVCAGFYNGAL